MGMIAELLCKIGIHLKKGHVCNFTDCISGKSVYDATCACGKTWMVDTLSSLAFFSVET